MGRESQKIWTRIPKLGNYSITLYPNKCLPEAPCFWKLTLIIKKSDWKEYEPEFKEILRVVLEYLGIAGDDGFNCYHNI